MQINVDYLHFIFAVLRIIDGLYYNVEPGKGGANLDYFIYFINMLTVSF